AAVNTTDAISFYGVPERYKSIWLEGVDFNDEVTAGGTTQSSSTRTALGPDAIQEFQVMGNSYSTEFGSSGSGVVNVVIKTGGNDSDADVTNPRQDANTVIKFTFQLHPKPKVNLKWLYDSRRYLNENFGGKTTRDEGYDDGRSSYFSVATLTSLLSANTVNEFRANRSIQRLLRSIPKGTLFLPTLVFPSGTFGTGTGNPQARIQKNWIFSDTLTYQ